MSAPACFVITAEQWAELMQLVAVLPLATVAVYAFVAHLDSWEHRVRRMLRRRRIRAIRRARQVHA